MISFLAICSLLALCLEVGLQICVLFPGTDADKPDYPLLAVITSLLVFSVLVTNLSSLLLALRTDPLDLRASEKAVCILLHCLQLGLGWRVYRLLVRYNRTAWLHLTSLRLVHVCVASFFFFVLQARVLFFPGRAVKPLPVLSLTVSLWSCSVALCSYTLRHKLHEVLVVQEAVALKISGARRYAGLAMLLAGTFFCLLVRLSAFTLLSAEHAFWVFLPFCLHFSVQAIVHFACSRQSANSSRSSRPTPKSGSGSGDRPAHHAVSPPSSANGSSLTTTPDVSATTPAMSFQPPGIAGYLLRGLARCYLHTWDLVEGEVGRLRCSYVLFYTVVLVENLAMTAAWLLHSPLDYTVKLVVLVVLLAAFLVALLLKFASCGCAAAADICSDRALYTDQDSPRVFAALQDLGTADTGDCGEGIRWTGTAGHHTRTMLHRISGKDFFTSSPRDRTNTGLSLATVSSLASADGRRLGRTRRDHLQKRRWSHPDNGHTLSIGLSDSVLLEALREQRKMAPSRASHGNRYAEAHRKHETHRRETHTRSQLASTENSLTVEDRRGGQHNLIKQRYDSSETLWTTSLGTLAEHPDGCSFDDPVLASRLVLESLEQPRPESQHSSSSRSRHKHRHCDRASSDGRFYQRSSNKPTSKVQLLLANRRTAHGAEKFRECKPSRTRRHKPACDSYEFHRAGDEYRYMTRCSCRGSPSSTPRRRPGHQLHTRKTHSYGSHHHSRHHSHRRSNVVPRTEGVHNSDTKHANTLGLRTMSQTRAESSRWAKGMSSRTPRRLSGPARRLSAVDSRSSITTSTATTTSSSLDGFPSGLSRCRHHHGNNGSERAATWPRRHSRRRTRAHRKHTARPALTRDAVCNQHVVHKWLQGLDSPDECPQDPGHVPYPPVPSNIQYPQSNTQYPQDSGNIQGDNPARRTRLNKHDARLHTADCHCSDCSLSVELDDDDDDDDDEDDDSDDSVQREKLKYHLHDLPHPNRRTQTFERCQHGKTTLADSWCVDERSLHGGQFGKTDRKGRRPVVSSKCLNTTTTELPLTCGERQTQSSSSHQRNSHLPGVLHYVVPTSTHHREFHVHERRHMVRTDTSNSNSSRSDVKGRRHQETFSRSAAHCRPVLTSVPDSGVSLSTVQDSDGSRSNAQGHTYTIPRSRPQVADLEVSRPTPLGSSKRNQGKEQIAASCLQWDGKNKNSDNPDSGVPSDKKTAEHQKITLDTDESLV